MEDLNESTAAFADEPSEATGGASTLRKLLIRGLTMAGLAAVAGMIAKRLLSQGPSDNWQSSYTPKAPGDGPA
ncbi:MAG: hypothetical protein V9F00_12475 [Nocardioides sp.]|jgi:hypothetical protein